MIARKEALDKAIEMLKKIEPTQDSIANVCNSFMLLSCQGATDSLKTIIEERYFDEPYERQLSFLFLINHIVLNYNRDEGRLKNALKPLISKFVAHTYKLCADKSLRADIQDMVKLWKESKTFDNEYMLVIENVLGPMAFQAAKENKPILLPENYSIPKYIMNLSEDYKLMNEWNEKFSLTKSAIETMLNNKESYSEVQLECKMAELRRCIDLTKKYPRQVVESIINVVQSMDSTHFQEVLQMKQISETIDDLKKFKN
jgi:hypothetical protein